MLVWAGRAGADKRVNCLQRVSSDHIYLLKDDVHCFARCFRRNIYSAEVGVMRVQHRILHRLSPGILHAELLEPSGSPGTYHPPAQFLDVADQTNRNEKTLARFKKIPRETAADHFRAATAFH